MITEQELKDMEARCEKATPGPWYMQGRLYEDECGIPGGVRADVIFGDTEEGECAYRMMHEDLEERDAEFIAHARTDLPKLIAECRKLRQQLIEAHDWPEEDPE